MDRPAPRPDVPAAGADRRRAAGLVRAFRRLACLAALAPSLARAGPSGWRLVQAGGDDPRAVQALVVVTPGAAEAPFLDWVRALEDEGLDAWLLEGLGGLPSLAAAGRPVAAAVEELRRLGPGRVVVAAHGAGGLAVLLGRPRADRLALVATPLAAWPDPPRSVLEVRPEGWPFPQDWTGPYAAAPLHPDLAAELARLPWRVPPVAIPEVPVLLVASGLDPVAPPEIVRLPSRAWPDRTFLRLGLLSFQADEPRHGELLESGHAIEAVAAFLAEGG